MIGYGVDSRYHYIYIDTIMILQSKRLQVRSKYKCTIIQISDSYLESNLAHDKPVESPIKLGSPNVTNIIFLWHHKELVLHLICYCHWISNFSLWYSCSGFKSKAMFSSPEIFWSELIWSDLNLFFLIWTYFFWLQDLIF